MRLQAFKEYLIPQLTLTLVLGLIANSKQKVLKNYFIRWFIATYQVNMQEALIEKPEAYASFNDFFIRHLKPECRPQEQATLVSPADSCISEMGPIQEGQLIQAKGKYYSLTELLACNEDKAKPFMQGQFITLYLSPKDYHRVHMPIEGSLLSMSHIPGSLFSVKPSTVNLIPKLFARNERLVVFFETRLGPLAMILVGATIVGKIGTSWTGDLKRNKKIAHYDYAPKKLHQGEEMGYFKLGSTVILLLPNNSGCHWNPSLKAGDFLRLGQALGF